MDKGKLNVLRKKCDDLSFNFYPWAYFGAVKIVFSIYKYLFGLSIY